MVGDVVGIDEETKLGESDFSVLVSDKDRQIQKIDVDKIRKRVIYEDEHRLVFDKPAGILVHPGNQHRKDLSMNDYLEKYVETLKG